MNGIGILKEQNPWWIAKEKINEDINIRKLASVKPIFYSWENRVFPIKSRQRRQIGENLASKNPKYFLWHYKSVLFGVFHSLMVPA